MIDRRHFLMAVPTVLMSPRIFSHSGQSLDVAYINAVVWTGVQGAPFAAAFGTIGNKIAAVGKEQVTASTRSRTRIVDLQGAFVTPGIIDAHTHFLIASRSLGQVNLRWSSSPAEFVKGVAEQARQSEPGEWMQGGNWDEQRWGGELPTRHWIDSVTPDTPVAIARLDLHMLLVNSVALKLAGIDRNTPDPDGGVIVRDKDGEPTGILKDGAKELVLRVIPPLSDAQIEQSFRRGIAKGLSLGVTQTHIKALDWISHDALRRLRRQGETDMRFSSFVPLQDWERLNSLIKEEGRGDDWVRWGGLKGLLDGSLGSSTALFHDHYVDAPGSKGITVVDPADLRQWIIDADRNNLHIAVHAIGDRANTMVLDFYAQAIKTNGDRDRRFIIEHAQHLRPEDIPRFSDLGVIASMQPYHAIDDGRWAANRIGDERLHGAYAFQSLLETGAQVSFGFDWPVAPYDPRTGIHAAVLRQTIDGANPDGWLPNEKVTVEAALRGYTVTNAYAGFQENRLGTIAPGYLADFVVFEDNLLSADPDKLTSIKILNTTVGGVQRHAG